MSRVSKGRFEAVLCSATDASASGPCRRTRPADRSVQDWHFRQSLSTRSSGSATAIAPRPASHWQRFLATDCTGAANLSAPTIANSHGMEVPACYHVNVFASETTYKFTDPFIVVANPILCPLQLLSFRCRCGLISWLLQSSELLSR